MIFTFPAVGIPLNHPLAMKVFNSALAARFPGLPAAAGCGLPPARGRSHSRQPSMVRSHGVLRPAISDAPALAYLDRQKAESVLRQEGLVRCQREQVDDAMRARAAAVASAEVERWKSWFPGQETDRARVIRLAECNAGAAEMRLKRAQEHLAAAERRLRVLVSITPWKAVADARAAAAALKHKYSPALAATRRAAAPSKIPVAGASAQASGSWWR
jgi:hypothetical protein